MFKKMFPRVLMVAVIVLGIAAISSLHFDVRVSQRDQLFGQAASYPSLINTYGAGVNGKPSFVISSQVIDTQTTVAAGTLNATNSTSFYDVTLPRTVPAWSTSAEQRRRYGTSQSQLQQSRWYRMMVDRTGIRFTASKELRSLRSRRRARLRALTSRFTATSRVHYAASGTGNFTFTVTAKQAQ